MGENAATPKLFKPRCGVQCHLFVETIYLQELVDEHCLETVGLNIYEVLKVNPLYKKK